jgi:hypothetical protein
MNSVERQIETLTRKAVNAAEEGRWNVVIDVYRNRGEQADLEQISPAMAQRIMALDEWILQKIKMVQAATAQQIMELQEKRRKLSVLKRQWGNEDLEADSRLLKTV